MSERICPGLPVDWLNAWLAAIGSLVLVPDLRLSWSNDPVPLAVLTAPGAGDPADLIAAAWPGEDEVVALPIARHLAGCQELPVKPSVDAWADRADRARHGPDGWALTTLYTDLAWDRAAKGHVVKAGSFSAPGPGTVGTVHDRLLKMVRSADPSDIGAVLRGTGPRVDGFGLGFDVRRVTSASDRSSSWVIPHVEVLAFYGLSLFPVRGDGVRRQQRGWSQGRGATFRWSSWRMPLSFYAVDAYLDAAARGRRRGGLGTSGVWESVLYEAPGKETAIGYGARRLEGPWDRQ